MSPGRSAAHRRTGERRPAEAARAVTACPGHESAVPVLEIGGSHVTAALVEQPSGRVCGGVRREPLVGDAAAEEILATLIRSANGLGVADDRPWAVALPGPFDYDAGVALFDGVGKFDALRGVDVGRALRDGIAAGPSLIRFLNDAHAFALGEWAAGSAAGHDRVVALTLGTGVGSAFLDAGTPVTSGPRVPPDGHAYRLTVSGRPLEDTVSRRAILRRYAEVAGEARAAGLDVADIAARARAHDPVARAVLDAVFTALGRAVGPWVKRFAATVVTVGGSMAQSWDLIGPPLRVGVTASVPDGAPEAIVRPARHLHDAALIGAARYVAVCDPRLPGGNEHPPGESGR
ncbi:ROK family protein [Streptomyces antimycoticus]|uniref:Glucokinase n=1 Tax=Streptomyces antimycoticus TaxID=68175 RepID=A0A4D4JVV7_9ACTN|nr:ROK family protein [Streptomyces antimycoticus]GDY40024.1 glucokinase [Streptomyces antimycoticus]